jgi:hypothetical protein
MVSPDLGIYYTGFGLKHIRDSAGITIGNIKVVMPDVEITHITDKYTPRLLNVDHCARFDTDIGWDQIAYWKGICYGTWIQCRDGIICDPDIVFQRPPTFGDWDVAVMFRPAPPHKAFNSGLIFSRSTAVPFWEEFVHMCGRMPKDTHPWWCDQLVFGAMLGIKHDPGEIVKVNGVNIALLDQRAFAPKLNVNENQETAIALHATGDDRKNDLEQANLRIIQRLESAAA